MHRAMPVLQVKDVERSLAFYCDKLGFRSCGIRGDGPNFAIVGRGGVTVALDGSQSDGPAPINQYWAAYIYVDDADALHDEFLKRALRSFAGRRTCFMAHAISTCVIPTAISRRSARILIPTTHKKNTTGNPMASSVQFSNVTPSSSRWPAYRP